MWAQTGKMSLRSSAEDHAAVISRFGRFPHRNAILGRANTPDEDAYLAGPDHNTWGQTTAAKTATPAAVEAAAGPVAPAAAAEAAAQ
jgi:hypothetical protein